MMRLPSMLIAGVLLGIPAPLAAASQPQFAAERVLPAWGDVPQPLAPGVLVSIYGEHLGPSEGCTGQADPRQRENPNPLGPAQLFNETLIYPKELCGTRVLVGEAAAGLLYVSARQINLKVPQDLAVEGTTTITVIYRGSASEPVHVPVSRDLWYLQLAEPAFAGLPVWLEVKSGYRQFDYFRYPFRDRPGDMGCEVFEVRRNRVPLKPREPFNTSWGGVISGPPCGSVSLRAVPARRNQIPLHLIYSLDAPGRYEVRYLHRQPGPGPSNPLEERAPWTAFDLQPTTPGHRAAWLDNRLAQTQKPAAELLSDILPSLLASRAPRLRQQLGNLLYHDETLVRRYVLAALLDYFPPADSSATISEALETRGPTRELAEWIFRRPPTEYKAWANAAISHLPDPSPTIAAGSLWLAASLRAQQGLRPEVAGELDQAVRQNGQALAARPEEQVVQALVQYLGRLREPWSRELLWGLSDHPRVAGQALLTLARAADPADLRPLGERLAASRDVQQLAYSLRQAYGAAALPYLREAVAASPDPWVRVESARELMRAGDPAGFRFAAANLRSRSPVAEELKRWIRANIPGFGELADPSVLPAVEEMAEDGP